MKNLSEHAATLAMLLLAIGLCQSAGCDRGAGPEQARGGAGRAAPAVVVSLVPVERVPVERTVEITGTLLGQEEATISSKVAGRVVQIAKDLGDVTGPGETLAQIDPRDFELALAERRAVAASALAKLGLTELPTEPFDASAVPTVQRARAEASNAEAKLDRATRLFEQSPPLISEQDYADIRTARDVARSQSEVELLTARAILAEARAQAAAVAVADQRLRDATVTAPGHGDGVEGARTGEKGAAPIPAVRRYRVAERLVSEGEYVTEGRQLFRLVSSDVIRLRARAPERFAGEIQAGQRATVITESSGGPVEGRVSRVAPAVDPASRTFAVEIEVDNAGNALKPGAFARGTVVTRIEENVTMVPGTAVVSFAGIDRVFGVKDGKAVEHRVRLGQRVGESVELVDGLQETRVIGANAAGLANGTAVEIEGGS